MRKNLFRLTIAFILISGLTLSLYASGGGMSSSGTGANSPTAADYYYKGVVADKAGDFKTAYENFRKAKDLDWNNPDILNMLAHSQRKLGMLDEALENYKRALKIKPDFPEAREYLGEAYIDAALREIDALNKSGKIGEDQKSDLIKALKDAADNAK